MGGIVILGGCGGTTRGGAGGATCSGGRMLASLAGMLFGPCGIWTSYSRTVSKPRRRGTIR